MIKNGQKVQVCIDGELTKNAKVLERIERDYGVVYGVQIEESNETMIVNEEQLSDLKAVDQMTVEERKWLESLKRCLKKKPQSIEILVQEMFNGDNGCQSEIHIMKKGVINESQTEVDDLICYSPSKYSLTHITVNDVAANNHGY